VATTVDPPWAQPAVVRAEPLDDPRFAASGDPEILELS
jgi:hypothetical protein